MVWIETSVTISVSGGFVFEIGDATWTRERGRNNRNGIYVVRQSMSSEETIVVDWTS
jgi:hypothetical protein